MKPLNRLEKSKIEIAALPPARRERLLHVREHGAELSPETLVHLIREDLADVDMIRTASDFLIGAPAGDGRFQGGHVEPVILAEAARYGLHHAPDELDEFRARCHDAMWRAIEARADVKPFWEERFYLALRDAARDARRGIMLRLQRYAPLAKASTNPKDESQVPDDDDGVDTLVFEQIDRQTINRVCAALHDDLRVVVHLRYFKGLQVESTDPAVLTVASALGVSGRTVRERLKRAHDCIRQNDDFRQAFGTALSGAVAEQPEERRRDS